MSKSYTACHLFAGIGAPERAIEKEGFPIEVLYTSEIDKGAIAVYQDHFPTIPCLGSIQDVSDREDLPKVDLAIAGTSCQSFSNKGKRDGLTGKSGILRHFMQFLFEAEPRAFIWENVASVLPPANSSNPEKEHQWRRILSGFCNDLLIREDVDDFTYSKNGQDGYAERVSTYGYNVAWVVLDASCTTPQSRKRVYMIGSKDMKALDIYARLIKAKAGLILQANEKEGAAARDFYHYLQTPEAVETLSDAVLQGLIEANSKSRDPVIRAVVTAVEGMLKSPDRTFPFKDFPYKGASTLWACFQRTEKKLPASRNFKLNGGDRLMTPCLLVGASNPQGHGASKPLALLYVEDGFIKGRTVTPEETEALMGFPRGWTKAMAANGKRRRLVGNSMCVDDISQVIRACLSVLDKKTTK